VAVHQYRRPVPGAGAGGDAPGPGRRSRHHGSHIADPAARPPRRL